MECCSTLKDTEMAGGLLTDVSVYPSTAKTHSPKETHKGLH